MLSRPTRPRDRPHGPVDEGCWRRLRRLCQVAGVIDLLRALAIIAAVCCSPLACAPASAGWLTKERLEKVFPSPLFVGERDDRLKIWPILKQGSGTLDLVAYAFESDDFAPIPGFGGTPPDLLIALEPDGTFLDVKLIRQHEPVFVDGLGPEPLNAFLDQYGGLSMRRTIRVGNHNARAQGASAKTTVDGVAMATASTRIINQEILSSAIAVAREKFGFSQNDTIGLKVSVKPAPFRRASFSELVARGEVKELALSEGQVDAAFAGTAVADAGAGRPGDAFARLYVAYLNVPSVGRSLLGDKAWTAVMAGLGPGDHAVMMLNAGPWSPLPADFVPASIPEALGINQAKFPVTVRDMAFDRGEQNGQGAPDLPAGDWTILKIAADAGFNPAAPWSFWIRVQREHGAIYPEKFSREFPLDYALPAGLFDVQKPDAGTSWTESFVARRRDLAIVLAMIALLVPVLAFQKGLVARPRAFAAFRLVYLAATLGFVGWVAQAQLSIVTVVGLVRAAVSTHDFAFLLYDPVSLLIWAFALLALVAWGRGTFCGWLCPFGALQELVAVPARWLKLPQITVPPRLDRRLRLLKYPVFAAIIVAAAISAPLADALDEVEPFKTSITLYFVRSAPFVAYALALLVGNLFIYKGFCRYLCPLGASLAVLGRLRLLDWVPRRPECGSPCQLCKVRCRYGAIEPSGRIDYPECFQCMDCVTIIHDPAQCVPQVLARKRGKAIRPQPARGEPVAAE